MRAHPGGLALVLALEAQDGAEQGCHQQAHEDLRDLALVGDIGEFGLDCLPDEVHCLVPMLSIVLPGLGLFAGMPAPTGSAPTLRAALPL
ncbi:hypothetical protein D9M71_715830 [compost metagenome]